MKDNSGYNLLPTHNYQAKRSFCNTAAGRDTQSTLWPPTHWLTSSQKLLSEEQPSGAWNNHACSAPTIIDWCCCDCWYMRNKSYDDTGDALSDGGPVLVLVSGQLRAINCRTSDTRLMQFISHTMDYSIYCLLLAAPAASMDQGCRREPGSMSADEQEPPRSIHQGRTPHL